MADRKNQAMTYRPLGKSVSCFMAYFMVFKGL